MIRITIAFSIFLLSITSCGNNAPKKHVDEAPKKLSNEDVHALFVVRCVSCHGEDGKLGVSGAVDLSLSKITDDSIKKVIEKGRNAMPAFISELYPEEIDALVKKVKNLRK